MNDCTYCGGIGCSECDVEQHVDWCKDVDCKVCADYWAYFYDEEPNDASR